MAFSSGAEGFPEYVEGLSADDGFFVTNKERRHAGYAAASGIFLGLFELCQKPGAFDRVNHGISIETGVPADL